MLSHQDVLQCINESENLQKWVKVLQPTYGSYYMLYPIRTRKSSEITKNYFLVTITTSIVEALFPNKLKISLQPEYVKLFQKLDSYLSELFQQQTILNVFSELYVKYDSKNVVVMNENDDRLAIESIQQNDRIGIVINIECVKKYYYSGHFAAQISACFILKYSNLPKINNPLQLFPLSSQNVPPLIPSSNHGNKPPPPPPPLPPRRPPPPPPPPKLNFQHTIQIRKKQFVPPKTDFKPPSIDEIMKALQRLRKPI